MHGTIIGDKSATDCVTIEQFDQLFAEAQLSRPGRATAT